MRSNRRPPVRGSSWLRARSRVWAGGLGWLGLVWIVFTSAPSPAAAQEGIALTSSTRQSLRHVQELWQQWVAALYQNDREQAAATIDDILRIARDLRASALPDLSLGASARALEAARAGQLERAAWALEAARRLDPDRPETDFAAAAIARQQGDYVEMLLYSVAGWLRLFKLPLERTLLLSNASFWLLTSLLLAGAAFVALLLVDRGRELAGKLRRIGLPQGAAGTVSLVLVLLLPAVLPSGLLWVVLLVSILLWAHASVSERVVLVGLWLLAGAMPLVMSFQNQRAQLALAPPTRFLDYLETGRLEGKLFADLAVLRALFPAEDPDVLEIVADLHRRLGQWEDAQQHYRELVEAEPENVTALINLGVTYHRKNDLKSAIFYFLKATTAEPGSALAFYDLSQSYSQAYSFNESRAALARAKELDARRVDSWLASAQGQGAPEMVFPADDDHGRIASLRRRLAEQMAVAEPSAQSLGGRYLGLATAALALILALALERLLRSRETREPATAGSAARPRLLALVPGLEPVHEREGVAAFFSVLLPIALLLVPLAPQLGYRLPLGLASGYWLLSALALLALLVFLLIRLRIVLRTPRSWST